MRKSLLALLLALFLLGACGQEAPPQEAPSSAKQEEALEAPGAQDQEGEDRNKAGDTTSLPKPDHQEKTASPPQTNDPTPPPPPGQPGLVAHQTQPADPMPAPEVASVPQAQTITLTVTHENQGLLADLTLEWTEGQTAYDALKLAAQASGLYVQASGMGPAVYVEGIGTFFEFDEGPLSGWHFLVNGIEGNKGAGQVVLQPGDRVHWQYRAQP